MTLVAGAADTKVSYRNQVPASANSRGSVQSGVIVRASVVRDYVGDSAARSGFTSKILKFQNSTAQSGDSLRAEFVQLKFTLHSGRDSEKQPAEKPVNSRESISA